jgi:hypothetical protein
MSTLFWVIVGTAAFFLLIMASLALAAILGQFSGQAATDVLEGEFWALAALKREETQAEREAPTGVPAARERMGAQGAFR